MSENKKNINDLDKRVDQNKEFPKEKKAEVNKSFEELLPVYKKQVEASELGQVDLNKLLASVGHLEKLNELRLEEIKDPQLKNDPGRKKQKEQLLTGVGVGYHVVNRQSNEQLKNNFYELNIALAKGISKSKDLSEQKEVRKEIEAKKPHIREKYKNLEKAGIDPSDEFLKTYAALNKRNFGRKINMDNGVNKDKFVESKKVFQKLFGDYEANGINVKNVKIVAREEDRYLKRYNGKMDHKEVTRLLKDYKKFSRMNLSMSSAERLEAFANKHIKNKYLINEYNSIKGLINQDRGSKHNIDKNKVGVERFMIAAQMLDAHLNRGGLIRRAIRSVTPDSFLVKQFYKKNKQKFNEMSKSDDDAVGKKVLNNIKTAQNKDLTTGLGAVHSNLKKLNDLTFRKDGRIKEKEVSLVKEKALKKEKKQGMGL